MAVVALVVCGAPLTRRCGDMVSELRTGGWEVRLVGTPSARAWIDQLLDVQPQFDFRSPTAPSPGDPDVVVVCPATFNTINKVAAGIADNYATSLIAGALATKRPVVVAPMISDKLRGHFALSSSIATLNDAGVRFLDVQTGEAGLSPVESGSGDRVVSGFQPSWLVAAVRGAAAPR